ncbi:hypothetical protein DID76_00450 [Candidatus Marinamargulisbacteria bacterium SCGC AG-414-C22]|nr:hypothetical protein DID76_00450 [Candidatus Marinamargulisbacteria bacterium SCGC AG-414-C22]
MRILMVTERFPDQEFPTHASFLYSRAKCYIDAGHSVTVLRIYHHLHDLFKKNYNTSTIPNFDYDIKVIPVHTLNYLNPLFRNKLLAYIQANFDIISAHWLTSIAILPQLLKLSVPTVLTCHGSDINYLRSKFFGNLLTVLSSENNKIFFWGRLLNNIIKKKQIKLLESCSQTFFVSTVLKEKAKSFGFNGFNVSLITGNGYNRSLFHTHHSTKKSVIRIGYVGYLRHVKGVDQLPLIFKYIQEKISAVEFCVVGDGIMRASIENKCNDYKLSNVNFKGICELTEVAQLMKSFTVLVLPSRNEGFGTVVVEAKACGVPTVGSNVGGIKEAVGDSGTVIDRGPHFEQRFADAVIDLIKNPIHTDILKTEAAKFTWESVTNNELNSFKKLVHKNFVPQTD